MNMNRDLIEKLKQLKKGLDGLPETVITGDKMRLFRLVIDREFGRAKYGVEVWGARTAAGRLPATRAAASAIADKRLKDITVEHTVPVGVLYEAFMRHRDDNDLQAVIDHYHVALVTKEEEKRISGAYKKAQSAMPVGWKFGDDFLARYRGSGVELEVQVGEVPR